MWGRRALFAAALLLFLSSFKTGTFVSAQSSKWLTLSGDPPSVIARGGFSGLFPDSSSTAYQFGLVVNPDTTLWCDVQLTKDGTGICLPDMKLDNCTNIQIVYPTGKKTYSVDGVATQGWFTLDYSWRDLQQVGLVQAIYSRTDRFDTMYGILTVDTVDTQFKPPALWLNIQHDAFYRQHNLSMRSYVLSVSRRVVISYISSPEVAFLSSIALRFNRSKTKLVFRFLRQGDTEPSTNQTYGSLLKNLTFVKTFASGILVPKNYIWPVTSDNYLQPYTSLVNDAHKEGLEVYVFGLVNDAPIPFNYSYDPAGESISYVDNGAFSVDGLVTDFPNTPAAAIGCLSHLGRNSSKLDRPVVISHNGASGDYPDCTDQAYKSAVIDGADVIDCPVQITKDGIPICMSSINLIDDTTITKSPFRSRTSIIPDIQSGPGIFTFNLTWEEIQQLQPVISTPEVSYGLVRNPRFRNSGKYMKLSEFLAFAKNQTLSGVLINIENAAFLAEKIGFSVTDAVLSALDGSGYNNQTSQKVMIQSTSSSVLNKFKQQTKYELVYKIDESIRDADASSVADIKKFADAAIVDKQSIYPQSELFITGETGLPKKLRSAGLKVYVNYFQNEFVTQAWDFFSDPYVEINTFAQSDGVLTDGVITDFPKSASRYQKNKCTKLGNNAPAYFLPVQVGGLLTLMDATNLPPALAPMPVLEPSDVLEPPLPNGTSVKQAESPSGGSAGSPSAQPSDAPRSNTAPIAASVVMLLGCLFLL